jgi:hypothetical protein
LSESFEIAERQRLRRMAVIIGALVAIPLLGFTGYELKVRSERNAARLSAAELAAFSAKLDQREAAAKEEIAKWNEASKPEALNGLVRSLTACPVTLKPPEQFSAGAYVKYATHDSNFGTWQLCVLRAGGSCARKYEAPKELTALRERIAEGDLYKWDEEPKPPEEPLRAVVVIDAELPANVQATQGGHFSFSPGTVTGHAYLYSPELKRFICGGAVQARNSKSVEIEYNHFGDDPANQQQMAAAEGHAALERDLEVQLRFAVPPGLKQLE